MKLHPEAKDDGVGGIKFAPLAGTDEEMADHGVVTWCIEKMSQKHDKPWFIAAGLVKPHMPWNVPKKWFDLFPLDQIQLPPHIEGDLGDVPAAGVKIAKPTTDHAAIVKSGRWKEAVQAYLATIAYCDYEIGRLIDAWEKSPEKDNTIICLWSDHGWSLGEKEHWRKFALWEEPTRTVFIWKAPDVTAPGGLCARPVDYASIYPTLCALAGIPAPAHLEGADITSLLRDPKAEWKLPAVTTWMKGNHAVRSEDWRYIRYADGSEELYHNSSDPLEHVNLAGKPDLSAKKAELAKFLPQKDAANLPRGKGGEGEEAEGSSKSAKKGKGKKKAA
jgi:arylsulfatase A-like enzyme